MIFEAPDWAGYELGAMRALVVVAVLRADLIAAGPNRLSAPVGIARVMDLGWFLRPRTRARVDAVAQVALLAFVADVAPAVSGSIAAAWAILALTVGLSDGALSHGRHLPVVALAGHAAGYVAWEVAGWFDAGEGSAVLATPAATGAWWAIQAILATYFVSGVSKLAGSGFRWAWQSPNILLAVLARLETARGGSGPARTARSERIVGALLHRPLLTRVLMGAGLLVELAAPLGLVDRWAMVVAGVALVALHRINGLILRLPFRKYQWVLVAYLVNVPYLTVEAAHAVGID